MNVLPLKINCLCSPHKQNAIGESRCATLGVFKLSYSLVWIMIAWTYFDRNSFIVHLMNKFSVIKTNSVICTCTVTLHLVVPSGCSSFSKVSPCLSRTLIHTMYCFTCVLANLKSLRKGCLKEHILVIISLWWRPSSLHDSLWDASKQSGLWFL